MSKVVSTTPAAESAGTKARRAVTWTLRFVGHSADLIGAVCILAAALKGQARGWELLLLALAVYGGTKAVEYVTFSTAELLDPDARDGDLLQNAELLIREIHEDLKNGADTDEVVTNLRESHLAGALADLVRDLADKHHAGASARGVWAPPLDAATWSLYTAEDCIGQA